MGSEIDVNALTVTVAGVATFGVVQVTRIMIDWLRELVDMKSPYTVRWVVTLISFLNIALWSLTITAPSFVVIGERVNLGAVAAWVLAICYLTPAVAWTVNSYHAKEQLNRSR